MPLVLIPNETGSVYYLAHLIAIGLVCVINFSTLVNGVQGIVTLKGDTDSLLTLSTLLTALHIFELYFSSIKQNKVNAIGFVCFIALGFTINCIGKFAITNRVKRNFDLHRRYKENYSVGIVENSNIFAKGKGRHVPEGNSIFSVVKEDKNNFFNEAFEYDICDYYSQKLTLASVIAVGIVTLLHCVINKDISKAIYVATLTSIMVTPIFSLVICSLPISKHSKILNKKRGYINSYSSVSMLANCSCVVLCEDELFSGDDIVINRMISSQKSTYQNDLLITASALKMANCALYSSFKEMINGNEKMLVDIVNLTYVGQNGMTFFSGNNQYFLGTRTLLMDNDVELPSAKFELQYFQEGKNVLYLSDSQKVLVTYVISYNANKEVKDALNILVKENMNFILSSKDPNINAEKVSKDFKIPFSKMSLLPLVKDKTLQKAKTSNQKDGICGIFNGGKFATFIFAISKAKRLSRAIAYGCAYQTVALVLQLLVMVFMVLTNSVTKIDILDILLIESFWAIVLFLNNKFFKC